MASHIQDIYCIPIIFSVSFLRIKIKQFLDKAIFQCKGLKIYSLKIFPLLRKYYAIFFFSNHRHLKLGRSPQGAKVSFIFVTMWAFYHVQTSP